MNSRKTSFARIYFRNVRWQKVINLILKDSPKTLLDLGSSKKEIYTMLQEKGVSVSGVDISQEAVAEALSNGVRAKAADLSQGIPFESESFDMVFAGEIIEHLVDTDFFLTEIHRVLKPGGKAVLTTPNAASLENRIRLLFGRQPLFIDYTSRGDNHVRAYTGPALKRQLSENGFRLEVFTGSFMPPIFYSLCRKFTEFLMPLLGILGTRLPSLSMHLIVKAKKI